MLNAGAFQYPKTSHSLVKTYLVVLYFVGLIMIVLIFGKLYLRLLIVCIFLVFP